VIIQDFESIIWMLELPWSMKKIPRPKSEKHLPSILSQEDVVELIEHAPMYKHQVFTDDAVSTGLTFVYGTGLRLSEALNLNLMTLIVLDCKFGK
jgi:site-specific recombinase XerD